MFYKENILPRSICIFLKKNYKIVSIEQFRGYRMRNSGSISEFVTSRIFYYGSFLTGNPLRNTVRNNVITNWFFYSIYSYPPDPNFFSINA
ncbi:hypothetical protein GCM10008119_09360 [Pedobacter mendelii]|uniref:Uncharacterized protein n=1 Tax=Pedobacter mendelii TaxID=1908240 RepID=A0ABQ2BDQ4_9SPHI|nr:hypothetical protein GCM10008119_09360 [Pedobacter mendelii]